jgi:sulfur-carrier protein adenylyltransferase/sulfurtransferase
MTGERDLVERYGRQMALPGFGAEAQGRLRESSALVVGAGGLGCPSLSYLAGAGIGAITVIDPDVVDLSNLHRQTLFAESDVGSPKVDRAADRIRGLNPEVRVKPIRDRLTSANALELIAAHDIVLDGTDRFETRYLVNDACVLTGRPNVYGTVFRYEGQVGVLAREGGPCYRCLFPEPPPPGSVPDCAEGGVIGAIPGMIGALQALEAIKHLAGIGRHHSDESTLLIIDGMTLQARSLQIRRDAECPVCGDTPTIRHLIDYAAFCSVGSDGAELLSISPTDLSSMIGRGEVTVLDVRTYDERAMASIGGLHIPLDQLHARFGDVPDEQIVVVCRSGKRSATAAGILLSNGHRNVSNLEGGLDAWRRDVDPGLPPA